MPKQRILGICVGVCILLLGITLYAQMARPTHDGMDVAARAPDVNQDLMSRKRPS